MKTSNFLQYLRLLSALGFAGRLVLSICMHTFMGENRIYLKNIRGKRRHFLIVVPKDFLIKAMSLSVAIFATFHNAKKFLIYRDIVPFLVVFVLGPHHIVDCICIYLATAIVTLFCIMFKSIGQIPDIVINLEC